MIILFECHSQATAQMEEKLKKFLEQNKLEEVDCDAITRFLHHQVMELARDCLQKSQDKQITGTYFFELSEKLEKLLIDVSDFHNVHCFKFPFLFWIELPYIVIDVHQLWFFAGTRKRGYCLWVSLSSYKKSVPDYLKAL